MKLGSEDKLTVQKVRARKSPWIETVDTKLFADRAQSGLVRARGLKHNAMVERLHPEVRARKSPWIETIGNKPSDGNSSQGS